MKDQVCTASNGFNLFGNIAFSNWAYKSIRFALSIIFIWSGVSKLLDQQSFAVIIESYGLIPGSWVLTVSVLLPLIELIGGVRLRLDLRGSLTTFAGLLLLFMLILGYGIWMGLDVDCGCFGPDDPESEAFLYPYSWRVLRSERPMGWSKLKKSLRRNG
jgi:uncharacterized membrane protein YphA (DoxX/SURF4 family)